MTAIYWPLNQSVLQMAFQFDHLASTQLFVGGSYE